MMPTTKTTVRRIEVTIHEHKTTHLLVATSKDFPGLYVAARSEEQIVRELPGAIREMLEVQGITVRDVQTERQTLVPSSFEIRSMVARATVDELAPA